MATDIEFVVEKSELRALLSALEQCGQVVSVFLKPKPPVRPDLQRQDGCVLSELFELMAVQEACADLGLKNPVNARYALLNRLEFEGSLVSVVMQGGCHRAKVVASLEAARELVAKAMEAAFPAPFGNLYVARIDSESWCKLAFEATLSASYVAWQSERSLWWVLCVADTD
jgi:hypothetical protein